MSIPNKIFKINRKCRNKFLVNMVWRGFIGLRQFRKRTEKGVFFPAFQFISVTNDCNLRCQGCWVSSEINKKYMDVEAVQLIIDAGKRNSSYFFGILGGEPTLHDQLSTIFRKNQDCYFQLFTNGTLFTKKLTSELCSYGNVTPIISLEGDETISDIRRGGHHIYSKTISAIRLATSAGLITGVAISVCKSNIEMALSDEFILNLHELGVHYVWYYIYRPAGSFPNYDLALDSDEIFRLRNFLVEGRTRFPIILIDSYWKANGEPFCPAADGLSHHINSEGYIEPCPVIQLAKETIWDSNIDETYNNSSYLRSVRLDISRKTRGCVFMEDPQWLNSLVVDHGAINTSNRVDYMEKICSARIVPSHGSCPVIPEKSIMYRIAKRNAFFGLGAYG